MEQGNHVTEIVRALGGRPVLLPIAERQKGPCWPRWQKTTWEETQTSEYQNQLLAGNIGVLLGRPSELTNVGETFVLVSIDVDNEDGVEDLCEHNLWIRNTLRTRGERGCNFWLWMERESYPAGVKKIFYATENGEEDKSRPWGEFRSDGGQTVIYGVHPSGCRYERISGSETPKMCRFSEIEWPPSLFVPWRRNAFDGLVSEFGDPWTETSRGGLVLNHPFFVGWFASRHLTLYEPSEASFYQYEQPRGLWRKADDEEIQWQFAADFKNLADTVSANEPEFNVNVLLQKRTDTFLRGLVRQLRGYVHEREAFARRPGLVHVANGVLDLTGPDDVLHDFSPEFYSRNQVPVRFDPEATCPRFLEELIYSAVSAEDADLMQRWAGSLLLGQNLGQRLMILLGGEGRGKSTFTNVMTRMIGETNCTQLRTAQLEERFELFAYVGKTCLVGADVPGNFMQQKGAYVIKALVGNDLLTAERKGGHPVQIRGNFNLVITCNSRLRVRLDGDTGAWRRRILLVHYDKPKPQKPDPLFLDHLLESESSGILNWMVEGARRLINEFSQAGGYILNEVHERRARDLLAESDSVREFVRQAVLFSDGSDITTHELGEAYATFCQDRGWEAEPYRRTQQLLIDAIQEIHRRTPRNDVKRNGKSQRGYIGLAAELPKAELVQHETGDE